MIGRRQLLGAAAALALSPQLLRAQEPDRIVDLGRLESKYVDRTQVFVWLPPDYDAGNQRYGVVYMHDGQNLFDPKRSSFNKVWAADKSALRLLAAGKTKPFIIVGIDQPGEDRWRQYFPQLMADLVSPVVQEKLKAQGNGKPIISDQYLKFIVNELKPEIDRLFLTRPDRKHTAIAGSSMGGLISLYAITKYPEVFGTAGAVSTHLPLGNPNWNNEERAAIFAAWRRYVRSELGKPKGRRIWFDHGTETLDAHYRPYQENLDAALVANGWSKGRDFSSRVYEGTPHEENAWAARLDDVFGWMLQGW
jgi:predicted alpha/beta superfamily hydrolase